AAADHGDPGDQRAGRGWWHRVDRGVGPRRCRGARPAPRARTPARPPDGARRLPGRRLRAQGAAVDLILLALAGAAIPVGLVIVATAGRTATPPAKKTPRRRSSTVTKAVVGLVVGVLVLAATAWVLPAAFAGAAGWRA